MLKSMALLLAASFLCLAQPGNVDPHAIGVLFDGGGSPLVSGQTISYAVPYGCTITGWDMIIDTGTASIDVWKTAYGSPYPTSSSSITAGSAPAVISGRHSATSNLTGWQTAVKAHDFFTFYVKYATGATQATLVLGCQ